MNFDESSLMAAKLFANFDAVAKHETIAAKIVIKTLPKEL